MRSAKTIWLEPSPTPVTVLAFDHIHAIPNESAGYNQPARATLRARSTPRSGCCSWTRSETVFCASLLRPPFSVLTPAYSPALADNPKVAASRPPQTTGRERELEIIAVVGIAQLAKSVPRAGLAAHGHEAGLSVVRAQRPGGQGLPEVVLEQSARSPVIAWLGGCSGQCWATGLGRVRLLKQTTRIAY
uniref:Uncharacterized protein n=1 Tax=Mycena chlorophos TaxID=658473 RepID=A0ABQ0M001_MYCCL|nr:predicted protein [Mycena chlorophos]